jgi:hypothetical protein
MSCNPVNSLRQYASKAYFMGERYLIQSRYTGIESVFFLFFVLFHGRKAFDPIQVHRD